MEKRLCPRSCWAAVISHPVQENSHLIVYQYLIRKKFCDSHKMLFKGAGNKRAKRCHTCPRCEDLKGKNDPQ